MTRSNQERTVNNFYYRTMRFLRVLAKLGLTDPGDLQKFGEDYQLIYIDLVSEGLYDDKDQ